MRDTYLKRIPLNLINYIFCSDIGSYFSLFLLFFINKIKSKDASGKKNKISILALTPFRFRGDLELLSETGQFEVYTIPGTIQNIIIGIINNKILNRNLFFVEYITNAENQRHREAFITSLANFLKPLVKFLKIKIVISAGIHYKQDLDFGEALRKIGVRFVVLHRENMKSNLHQKQHLFETMKEINFAQYDQVCVHNEICKEIISHSGLLDKDCIHALGCMRMDKYIRSLENNIYNNMLHKPRKRFTLFSFVHTVGIMGYHQRFENKLKPGYKNLFNLVHKSVIRMALANPEIEFVVKVKGGGIWLSKIESTWDEVSSLWRKCRNLKLIEAYDTHKLILSSDVISGFGSTALLESAIANKPVVFPYFEEAIDEKYKDMVQFANELDIFQLSYSIDEYEDKILYYLNSKKRFFLSNDMIQNRRDVFEKYVSSMSANSVEKHTDLLLSLVN